MSPSVALVLASAVATVSLKAVGPLVLRAHPLPAAGARIMTLLAPALLSALVATQTFGEGQHLVLDARAAGVGAATLAVLLRAPLLVTVVIAALVTALLRASTGH
ncbi:MAG: AzlD domain-containing protein [Candidatus Dormibacteraeota bacterium]|nr:AzlD domain-containing protein [Candidatus Dormibacteraeota bacterium]